MSRADEAGCIVFANTDFIEISGFSEAELLGQPHNIIRHPDMPAAVFADMWRDIKAGRPWVGMLKNRCKNGDAYWVEACFADMGRRPPGRLPVHAPQGKPGAGAGGRDAVRRTARRCRIRAVFEHGTAHGRGPFARLRRPSPGVAGSKLVLASLLAAIVILGITTICSPRTSPAAWTTTPASS